MVGNDERSMIDKDKGWPTAYGRWLWYDGRWLSYDGRWPKFVISFKLTRAIWIHLNVLKLLGIVKVRC